MYGMKMCAKMPEPRQFAKPNLLEALGLLPLRERFAQTLVAWRGAEDVPPMRWDRTALQQLYPLMSPKLWMGKPHVPRAIIITNLYNHTQTPIHEGWSTRKTQMNDFRGKKLTTTATTAPISPSRWARRWWRQRPALWFGW